MANISLKNTSEQKRQRVLIIILLVVVIITIIIMWYGFIGPQGPAVYTGNTGINSQSGSSQYKKNVAIDFNVLENPFLKEFTLFKDIAPLQNNPGRENPFLPINENQK